MNANELRIGNLVEYRGKEFIVVEIRKNTLRIKHWSGITSVVNISNCNPIELTEEWLIKFGFEKDPDYEYLKDCFDADCSFYLNNPNTPFSKIDFVNGVWFLRTSESEHYSCPKFVHKFQNWWYENTGEELKQIEP